MGLFKSTFFKLPRHQTFQYDTRYTAPEDKEGLKKSTLEKRIKFERGNAMRSAKSQIAGKLRTNYVVHKTRASKGKRYRLMLYMFLMLGAIYAFLKTSAGLFAVLLLLILLILFIRENNRF